jgi:F-type H+-transporting ATPase subunit b
VFFFEKKNQKTFDPWRALPAKPRQRGKIFFRRLGETRVAPGRRYVFNNRTVGMKRCGLAGASAACLVASAAHAETMPQLDFGNKLLTAQVIWGALIFLVFYLLVSRWGLPKVGAILEMRADTIARDLDQARAAKSDADQAVAELTAARRAAYAQSQAAIADAALKAKTEAAARSAEQAARLDAQLAQSEARIATARAAAMGALREVAVDAASAVVARLTQRAADEARVADAVGQVLATRGLA